MATIFFLKQKKWIWVAGALLISLVLGTTSIAHARVTCDISNACVQWGLIMLLLVIPFLFSQLGVVFLKLASYLTDYSLIYNYTVGNDSVIKVGFSSALKTANLGFVLAIIIIAFATILRSQSYGVKQMLWKLVVAAVMVNFSLLAAGVFLDFSHVLTRHFLHDQSLGQTIVTQFSAGGFIPSPNDQIAGINGLFDASFFKMWILSTFLMIVIWIMTITVFMIGIMLLIRYVYVAILLILMPLAWLLWITPRFTDQFGKWWDKFFQQVFYLPAVAFFLSLAIDIAIRASRAVKQGVLALRVDAIRSSIPQLANSVTNLPPDSLLSNDLLQLVLQLFILIGLMMGGLIAGKALSGTTASMAGKIIRRGKQYGIKTISGGWKYRKGVAIGAAAALAPTVTGYTAAGYLGTRAYSGIRRLLGQTPLPSGSELGQKAAKWTSGALTSKVGRILPGSSILAAGLAGIGSIKKEVDEYKKSRLDPLNKNARQNLYAGPAPSDVKERAAIVSKAIDEGELNDLMKKSGKHFGAYLQAAAHAGLQKEVTKANPTLAARPIMMIGEDRARWDKADVVGKKQIEAELTNKATKKTKSADFDKMSKETYADSAFMDAMDATQLSYVLRSVNIDEETRGAAIENFKKKMLSARATIRTRLGKDLESLTDEQIDAEIIAIETAIPQMQEADKIQKRSDVETMRKMIVTRRNPVARRQLEIKKPPKEKEGENEDEDEENSENNAQQYSE